MERIFLPTRKETLCNYFEFLASSGYGSRSNRGGHRLPNGECLAVDTTGMRGDRCSSGSGATQHHVESLTFLYLICKSDVLSYTQRWDTGLCSKAINRYE